MTGGDASTSDRESVPPPQSPVSHADNGDDVGPPNLTPQKDDTVVGGDRPETPSDPTKVVIKQEPVSDDNQETSDNEEIESEPSRGRNLRDLPDMETPREYYKQTI